jgi:hypothetical protein
VTIIRGIHTYMRTLHRVCTHLRVNAPDDGHLMTETYVG